MYAKSKPINTAKTFIIGNPANKSGNNLNKENAHHKPFIIAYIQSQAANQFFSLLSIGGNFAKSGFIVF